VDTTHDLFTRAIKLLPNWGSGVLVVNIASGVLELSILSLAIARGPTITELISECDKETGLGRARGVLLVTHKFISDDKGRTIGWTTCW
jgi:hypothetical protein